MSRPITPICRACRRTIWNRSVAAPQIVTTGAPMRNIAPCGACHGDIDNKAGSPWLGGQSAVYIKAQLQAFASGTRRNDISQQMRNIARQMTAEEIDAGRPLLRGPALSREPRRDVLTRH